MSPPPPPPRQENNWNLMLKMAHSMHFGGYIWINLQCLMSFSGMGGGEMTKIAINCSKIREILSITREPWVYGPCPKKSVRVTEIPWGLATLDTHIHRTHTTETDTTNRQTHTHIHKIHTTNTRRAPQDTYTHTRAHTGPYCLLVKSDIAVRYPVCWGWCSPELSLKTNTTTQAQIEWDPQQGDAKRNWPHLPLDHTLSLCMVAR